MAARPLFGYMKMQHTLGQPLKTECGRLSGREIKNSHICDSSPERWVSYLSKNRNAAEDEEDGLSHFVLCMLRCSYPLNAACAGMYYRDGHHNHLTANMPTKLWWAITDAALMYSAQFEDFRFSLRQLQKTSVTEKGTLSQDWVYLGNEIIYGMFIYLYIYHCICPLGFFPWKICVAFLRVSLLPQSHAIQPTVHAGGLVFSLSIHSNMAYRTFKVCM